MQFSRVRDELASFGGFGIFDLDLDGGGWLDCDLESFGSLPLRCSDLRGLRRSKKDFGHCVGIHWSVEVDDISWCFSHFDALNARDQGFFFTPDDPHQSDDE